MATSKKAAKGKAGDSARGGVHEERFLKAFDEYSDALFRHAVYRLSDRERAIEIVHDAYTKAWSYVASGNTIDAYKSFLYKILNNLIIDEYRRRKETSLDMLFEKDGVDEGAFSELHAGGIEEITFMMDARQAAELLTTLPHLYREVLTFRYIDGLGPKEISELIEETENVVSVRIHRGLSMLREYITQAEDEARTKRIQPLP